jgi:hypothetical protein
MIPGSANSLLLASAADDGYNIERSLRFNSADSAYLSRTPASAGNRKTWTWAGWVKRSTFGSNQRTLFSTVGAGDATTGILGFDSSDRLFFGGFVTNWVVSSAVYRDPSAWFHVVCVQDTTQATASNRVKLYVNGIEITAYSTDNRSSISQNADLGINRTDSHSIGRQDGGSPTHYFPGYLADIHFIDGQALDPTSFGEFDATTGVWVPKAYTGTYGTNGFFLEFADNSSNTATTLGKDTSGNGNNWTPNNLSVTAGTGNDSLVDVPTNGAQTDTGAGGQVRGNYCTLNPLASGSAITLSNGNLDGSVGTGTGSNDVVFGTIGIASGKWYWEVTANSGSGGTYRAIGIGKTALNPDNGVSTGTYVYYGSGEKAIDGSGSSYGASYTNGDVIGVAFDADAGTLTFYKNGTTQGTAATGLTAGPYVALAGKAEGALTWAWSCNFGQRPFAYTAPSGFKALNTANLPAGTITTSGSFTGNANADGPFVWLNGVPTAMTINGNAVTFGTHADKLANGFKVRSSSGSYNTAGSNTYSITTTGAKFKDARAQPNP